MAPNEPVSPKDRMLAAMPYTGIRKPPPEPWSPLAPARRCGAMSRIHTDTHVGPWTCGDGVCGGSRADCEARYRNEWEAAWLERELASWESAWLRAYGLPLPMLADAAQHYERTPRA